MLSKRSSDTIEERVVLLRQLHVTPPDPLEPTPMRLAIDQIKAYDRNPRRERNEAYERQRGFRAVAAHHPAIPRALDRARGSGAFPKVVEIEHQASGARERYIALDLLAYQGGTWGYKDLSEAEHPYYYSCPLGYLEMVPAECAAWREGVRTYHRRFAVGQCVRLSRCRIPWVRITQLKPLRGEYDGIVYRLRRTDLSDFLTETAP